MDYCPSVDGEDYIGVNQTLTFQEGVSRFDINITIVGDRVQEPLEQFSAILETSDGDVRLNPSTTTIEISDTLCKYTAPSDLVQSIAVVTVRRIRISGRYDCPAMYHSHFVTVDNYSVKVYHDGG